MIDLKITTSKFVANPIPLGYTYDESIAFLDEDKTQLKKNVKLLARGKSLILESINPDNEVIFTLISRGKRYIELRNLEVNLHSKDKISNADNSIWSLRTTLNVLSRKLEVYKED